MVHNTDQRVIHGDFGTLRFINIYNDGTHGDTLDLLGRWLRDPANRVVPMAPLRYVWGGDFNRHHPLWDEERNAHLFTNANLNATQPFLNLLTRYHMKMALPKNIPTLRANGTGNYTRLDNIFCSDEFLDFFIVCDVDSARRPVKTDHFPIHCIIDIVPTVNVFSPRRMFRNTDWEISAWIWSLADTRRWTF